MVYGCCGILKLFSVISSLCSNAYRRASIKGLVLFVCGSIGSIGSMVAGKAVAADNDVCKESNDRCVEQGRWELSLGFGYGEHTNPVVNGDAIPIVLIPKLSYYGKRFFLDGFSGGYTLLERSSQQLSLIVSPSYEQMYFKRWSIGNVSLGGGGSSFSDAFTPSSVATPSEDGGLSGDESPVTGAPPIESPPIEPPPIVENKPELDLARLTSRNTTVYGGVEYGIGGDSWSMNAQLLRDVSVGHQGTSARVAAAYVGAWGSSRLSLSSGFSWQSSNLLAYYYGVSANETEYDELRYRPDAGISPFAKIQWSYDINHNWSIQASYYYRQLSDQITNSPIIERASTQTYYIGGLYHF
ncbi:MAG: outer membrane protein [Flavobacteriales bacterium]